MIYLILAGSIIALLLTLHFDYITEEKTPTKYYPGIVILSWFAVLWLVLLIRIKNKKKL